ncbi:competence/damage-inducible protein A [Paenirhodobacter sp. CAU 1674]|jgi:molybdenum cofactor synthesis domain-containing protein|uniref:competence/damage-inducible protein A n=1 Tax=Paenirhodobacter sp. CAU 1674 TaxID=3032596 RepID=UPI0023DA9A09|nr:competence/damage-inducible protein A [Paenirhodobacter sp. CAU 1674]MDF2140503.1 competence/damage-inducible protein A [Paenirhodobacter sp. CAU 1674]
MPNPTAAILIIGDEILTGRTREGNAHHLAGELVKVGIDLRQIRVISDDHQTIVAAVRELAGSHDHLFTSGGIGPTHDDITADAVAEAFGRTIDVREDARAILAAHYAARGVEFTAARLRMARIPEGARLIDNPVSGAPGFSVGNCHVMAGVPNIFQAMVAGLLPGLTGGAPLISRTWQVMVAEASIADDLRGLVGQFPDLSFGSYPFVQDGVYGTNLVVRGTDPAQVAAGHAALQAAFPEGK